MYMYVIGLDIIINDPCRCTCGMAGPNINDPLLGQNALVHETPKGPLVHSDVAT